MATSPPYLGVTGVFTTIDKHIDVTKTALDGNAKPGQLVVDTSDYTLYVGNSNGNLNAVGGAAPTGDANFANFAGNVTVAAQPNITSTGTLTSLNVAGSATIGGNLEINGTMTTVNTATLDVADINITVAKNANTAFAANGAGLTVNGAAATMLYVSSTDTWNFNKNIIGNIANANYATAAGTATSATVAATANSVAGANVTGNVATAVLAYGVAGANVTGNVTSAVTANFANFAGNVTGVAQSNITSVGTLTSLAVSGDITTAGGASPAPTISGFSSVDAEFVVAKQVTANINGTGTNFVVGDDAYIGDVNETDTISIKGQQDSTKGYIIFGDTNKTSKLGRSGSGPLTYSGAFTATGNISTDGEITIANDNSHGGAGYAGLLTLTNSNSSAVTPNKFVRLNHDGNLQVIDSGYNNTILELSDAGKLTVASASLGSVTGLTITGGTSGQVMTTDGSGVLSWTTVSGGGGATDTISSGTSNVVVAASGNVTTSVAGNSNIFTVTGVGANVAGNLSASGNVVLKGFTETVATPTFSATFSPNVAVASIQKFTATANFTFNDFTSPVAGQSATVIITQDGTGSRLMTSTMKFVGGAKTLSTAANSIDIISVFYDGTTYYASLTQGYA